VPPITPAVLSDARILAATLIFLGSYFVFALGKFPWMKIDRPGAAILVTRIVNPRQVYDEVDWGLLVFFVGLFIIVGGAERAGLVSSLLYLLSAWNVQQLPLFVAVTATLSNVVSNVPAVMLLKILRTGFPRAQDRLARSVPLVHARGQPHHHWLRRQHHRRRACLGTRCGHRLPRVLSRRPAADAVDAGAGHPLAFVDVTIQCRQ
jgi:Citrate transporter